MPHIVHTCFCKALTFSKTTFDVDLNISYIFSRKIKKEEERLGPDINNLNHRGRDVTLFSFNS